MKIHLFEITPEQLKDLIAAILTEKFAMFKDALATSTSNELKELNTPKETAEYFGISKPCLHSWNQKGILKAHKIGGRVYYKRTAIELLTAKTKG